MKEIFVVDENATGKRIDVFLDEVVQDVTRSQIKKSITEGKTTVNGEITKAGKQLKIGDVVEFEEIENITEITPENIPLNIVYEDDDVIVINKPQGMTVHPAPGNYTGTLVNALLYHFGGSLSDTGGNIRPGIVHRIDKDTSGLLVVAKNNSAHLCLAKQLADKTCNRQYVAVVEGVVKDDEGVIDAPIGRSKADRKKMAVVPDGKPAVTMYKVRARCNDYTFMQFNLKTGRTHQIRVHTKFIGHPIVGDKTYGIQKQKFNLAGQLLHAEKLEFIHPTTKKLVTFFAPLPDYFQKILKIFD